MNIKESNLYDNQKIMTNPIKPTHQIALFEWKEVRKIIHNNEWRFVVVDVVEIMTDSKNPSWYIKDMRRRDEELSKRWGQIATPLAVQTWWWQQKLNCANTEWMLRIIQSIPSPRAEPFKKRLAKVGYERIQEIEDPELSMKRMIETYEKKWYPKEWVDIRTRGIPVRKWLTNERDKRGWDESYGVLTNDIYQAYAWMTNKQWMEYKKMNKWNLRDGMTPTELILTMLAEQATTDITKYRNAEWLHQLLKAGKDWWWVAMKARQELIEQTWSDPISPRNFLENIKWNKKIWKVKM